MKLSTLLFASSILSLAVVLSACGSLKDAYDFDATKDLKTTVNQPPVPTPDASEPRDGGPPGNVNISGVVVRNNGSSPELDGRISVALKGGIGISGSEVKFDKSQIVHLSTKNQQAFQFHAPTENSIIAVGCDEKTKNDYTQEQHLIPSSPVENKKDVTITLEANTVVLCGKIDFGYQFVTVNADKLVLHNLDYSQTGWMTISTFNANKLILVGANKILAKGWDSDVTLPLASNFILGVFKDFQPNDGSLAISSYGSSYIARHK